MKILMVNKFLYPNGGSETYLFKIGEYLNNTGHEVQYFGMEHEARIVGNRAESYTSGMDFHTGKLSRLLYPFKIIYSPEARKKLRIVLEDFHPDIVHLNNFNFQLTPSIIYEVRNFAKKCGKKIPLIYTAHDYQWVCPNHMMYVPVTGQVCEKCIGGRFADCTRQRCIHGSLVKSLLGSLEGSLYRRLGTYRLVDTIICPSEFLNSKLSKNRALRDKTVTMHNFIDRPEVYGEDIQKEGYVLYFGRFSEEKGIKTLLDACRALPEIPFIFAGSGPLSEEVGKVKNIKNLGFVTGDRLVELIKKAKFSIYASEWYENCPFSVMESQICGTPVLGAAIGGIPELIADGETGELFTSGNVAELRKKILKLWSDEALLKEYTKNCRQVKFDTTAQYCRKLLELYKK